jgi:hypothetical protein
VAVVPSALPGSLRSERRGTENDERHERIMWRWDCLFLGKCSEASRRFVGQLASSSLTAISQEHSIRIRGCKTTRQTVCLVYALILALPIPYSTLQIPQAPRLSVRPVVS